MNGASEIFWRSSLQNTKINTKVKTNLNLKKKKRNYLLIFNNNKQNHKNAKQIHLPVIK